MPTLAASLREFDIQATSARSAIGKIASAGNRTRPALEQALWGFVKPYWAILSIVEGVVESGPFEHETLTAYHLKLLPLEQMADEALGAAKRGEYSSHSQTAGALLSLQGCNERIKDCMVALESMLDPRLDHVMAGALGEHRRGETVPLDTIH